MKKAKRTKKLPPQAERALAALIAAVGNSVLRKWEAEAERKRR